MKTRIASRRGASARALYALAFIAGAPQAQPAATDAEIISIIGRGEARASAAQDWAPAAVRQLLAAGAFVRTLDLSQMALLLRDRTQLRLNQNSVVQIKSLAEGGQPTRLELKAGRSWMQARPGAAPSRAAAEPTLLIETPNAIAAIRGTDWELVVGPDGVAVLTVISGEVDFYNDFGRVSVRANEQARAERGRAPVKVLLTDARDRVQWVTAYRPQPRRWAHPVPAALDATAKAIEEGDYASALFRLDPQRAVTSAEMLMLADLLVAQGRLDEAVALSRRAMAADPRNGRAPALLARALLINGRADEAGRLLREARASHGGEVEVWLASGDLARYLGEAAGANEAYERALAIGAQTQFAWFGLGVVASEREEVRPARAALGEALKIEPRGPGFRGELGTLETFADDFGAARAAFDAALADHPDDYVALTGLGLLQLKRGETEDALTSFLKAGVIEPRYARAALYTGVAYYQLGRHTLAVEQFRRAAEIDPRDPLPHVLMTMVATDEISPGEAVRAAQAANERMPYLKSLNQLLNNQKGNANVGSALALFGLSEWAEHYAYQAYNPYWAGSHLFLADRVSGLFAKNSELFQGFITDPTVFGASNRFSTLLPRPGDYVTLNAGAVRQALKAGAAQAIFNGYHNAAMPFAYFADLSVVDVRPYSDPSSGDIRSGTLGLGARPRHDIGIFLFATSENLDSNLVDQSAGFIGNPQSERNHRGDLGFNFRFAPDSQAWLKLGSGDLARTAGGTVVDQAGSDAFNAGLCNAVFLTCFGTTGALDYRAEDKGHELQWRHTFDASAAAQVSWGIEYARRKVPLFFTQQLPAVDFTFAPPLFFTFFYGMAEQTLHESLEAYVSARAQPGDALLLQADLAAIRAKKHFVRDEFFGQFPFPPLSSVVTRIDRKTDELNPRLGLAWQAAPGQTLRLAWQKWRRPAGQATLGMVDTAGILLDDRLVAVGGGLQRLRAQYEWEVDRRTFVQVYADRRKIDNLPNPGGQLVTGTSLENLERLRSLATATELTNDVYEAEPDFAAGRVRSAGMAINRILGEAAAASAAYAYHGSENAGGPDAGKAIPFLARHALRLSGVWVPAPRLRLGAVGTYRAQRFADESNASRIGAGWSFAIEGSWETRDKRFGVGFLIENLLSRSEAGVDSKPLIGARITLRL